MQFLCTEYKPWQLQEILNDRTYGKHVSHSRLKAFIAKHDVNVLVRVYLRSHLLALCEAYNVAPLNKRATKKVLGLSLWKLSKFHCRYLCLSVWMIDCTELES